MVRKGTGYNNTTLDKRCPGKRNTNEIDSGRDGPIGPRPSKGLVRRMTLTPRVKDTALTKKGCLCRGTLSTIICRGRTASIQGSIKNTFKVPAQHTEWRGQSEIPRKQKSYPGPDWCLEHRCMDTTRNGLSQKDKLHATKRPSVSQRSWV